MKMSASVKEARFTEKTKQQINFMGGTSYGLSPVETMKMVTASSIMGEPQYYRDGEFAQKGVKDGVFRLNSVFADYAVIGDQWDGMKTSEVMEKVIDNALDADFEATIRWALELRKDYFMRLNPQVIMVRAAMHPKRVEFNEKHPGLFSEINAQVMSRADEPSSQLTYWLYRNGSKKEIPSVLKRNWAKRLENGTRYELAKYKNTNVGMIDTVRICHANSPIIDELMQTGTIKVDEDESTWERMRSAGKSWKEIWDAKVLGHMALLRNLRNIFTEIEDPELCKQILNFLKNGVLRGKQFPFRYWSAYKMIEKADVHHKPLILDALEECMDIACDNMPKLKGKTMCLSDNSGSAWGAFTSEYGSVTIAEIDNLSSVIVAKNSDEGYVGKFGDKLIVKPVSKRNGVLAQSAKITERRSSDVGGSTENGIWLFFKDAIDKKQHWDNILIFSDQQCGHGGLYGYGKDSDEYRKRGFNLINTSTYIDVAKLIQEYRNKVNPKVNVYCVQTAGYTNVLVPEYGYRTNILYGWTGKEILYADTMNRFWDEHDKMKTARGLRSKVEFLNE